MKTLLQRYSNATSDHLNLGGGLFVILYPCLLKKISVNHRKGDGQVPHLGKCTSYKLSHRGKISYKLQIISYWKTRLELITCNFVFVKYIRESINSFKTLNVNISNNKARIPINLGAKLEPLISSFRKWSWILNLTQYWLSYGLEKSQNLNLKNTQNESSLLNRI